MVNFTNIPLKSETKERFDLVIKEFIAHHPEFKHVKLSYDVLVNKLIDYYLDQ